MWLDLFSNWFIVINFLVDVKMVVMFLDFSCLNVFKIVLLNCKLLCFNNVLLILKVVVLMLFCILILVICFFLFNFFNFVVKYFFDFN